MIRKKLIAGNWKMNKTPDETYGFLKEISSEINCSGKEVAVFPPFISLAGAAKALAGTDIFLGAQNMHYEAEGAYTGEISAEMLIAAGCSYVLIAHSERRLYFSETSPAINLKINKALSAGIKPVLCVGENLEMREAARTFEIISAQLRDGLENVSGSEELIIAYEPVWAIGTGKNATAGEAGEACTFIRGELNKIYGSLSEKIRILYGGSVKASNAESILSTDNIDGVLVGGASLTRDFIGIANYDS